MILGALYAVVVIGFELDHLGNDPDVAWGGWNFAILQERGRGHELTVRAGGGRRRRFRLWLWLRALSIYSPFVLFFGPDILGSVSGLSRILVSVFQ